MDPPCEKSGLTPEGDCRDSVSLAGVSLRLLVKGPFLVLARGLWLEGQGRFFAITGRRGEAGVLAAPFMSANRSPPMVAVNKEIIGCEKVLSGFFAWRSSGWEF